MFLFFSTSSWHLKEINIFYFIASSYWFIMEFYWICYCCIISFQAWFNWFREYLLCRTFVHEIVIWHLNILNFQIIKWSQPVKKSPVLNGNRPILQCNNIQYFKGVFRINLQLCEYKVMTETTDLNYDDIHFKDETTNTW